MFENAAYARGSFHLSDAPLISLFFPAEYTARRLGSTTLIGGHLVFSALLGLGIGLALLYGSRVRRPVVVLLVAALAAILEHALANTLALDTGRRLPIGDFLSMLTLGGYLTSLLLIAGIGYVLHIEWRAIGVTASRPEDWLRMLHAQTWLRLPSTEAQRRSMLLARAQLAARPLVQVAASPLGALVQERTS